MNHTGTVKIQTDRLNLRPFTFDDAHDMYKNWASDDEVTKYLSWPSHKSVEVTQMIVLTWLKNYEEVDCYHWAMELDGAVIGNVTLLNVDQDLKQAELGYCMSRAYWNKGLMTEAVKGAMAHARAVGFNTLTARHHSDNPASGHVMKKCGMVFTHKEQTPNPKNADEMITCDHYSMTL